MFSGRGLFLKFAMFFRYLAILFLSLSVCAATAEAYLPSPLDSTSFFISSLDLFALISPKYFHEIQALLQKGNATFWGPILASALAFPGWFLFGFPGAIFVWISFVKGGKDGGKESARLAALREYEKSLSTFDRIPTEDELGEPLLDQYDLPLTDKDDLIIKNESQRTDDVTYVEFMEQNDPSPKDQGDMLSQNVRRRTDDVTYVEFMNDPREEK